MPYYVNWHNKVHIPTYGLFQKNTSDILVSKY